MKTATTLKFFVHASKYLAFLLGILILGCKKVDNNIPAHESTNTTQRTVAEVLFNAAPEANSKITQLSADKKVKRTLTPVSIDGSLKFYKYILVETGSEGDILKINRLVSKTKINESSNLFSLPLTGDGRLSYYDANIKKNLSSKVLMKTKGTRVTKESVANDLKEGETSNLAPVCTNGICIDHWWVIYDTSTGQIYSIEYVGSDCYEGYCDSGTGGGGGGGPTPPTCEQLTAVAQAIADDTYAYSDLKFITENATTPTTRQYTYQWICLINYGGWGLLSTERGVHKKVNPRDDKLWQWVSLTHVNVVKEGLSIGGSVDHSEAATSTVGLYNAGMTLAINLKFNIACVPTATIEKNFTSQRIFNVNETPATPY